MAGMDKYKYMPLSEANLKPVMVTAYDGQDIYVQSSSASSSSAPSSSSSSASFPSGMTLSAYASSSFSSSSSAEPKLFSRYSMGNYLGNGIAGVVNEAYDNVHQRHVAIKMLNPVGYKLASPSGLRRAEIIKRGVPFVVPSSPLSGGGALRHLTLDHVYWVKQQGKRDLVACYVDARFLGNNPTAAVTPAMLKELTLDMCVALWDLDADDDDAMSSSSSSSSSSAALPSSTSSSSTTSSSSSSSSGVDDLRAQARNNNNYYSMEMKGTSPSMTATSTPTHSGSSGHDDDDMMMLMLLRDDDAEMLLPPRREQIQIGDVVYTIPRVPAKYKAFLQSRRSIYREIAHMHKLTGNSVSGHVAHGGHDNVLKLYDVLEYVQPSKSTIFLVLELAAGGELFDRIRSDNGVDDSVARGYFTQLLSGVLFCHQLGIVHRDLKPENLLLSDNDVLKIADFGLSAHFIAAVSSGDNSGDSRGSSTAEDHDRPPELDDDDAMDRSTTTPSSLLLPAARFRRLNSIVGSPHYVAPEILQNARYGYDGRKADMWSVGVILYSMLAGSLPFGKELQTCPRYLKFCEWIRSLPCDPQTGKLVFDASVYQASTTYNSQPVVEEPLVNNNVFRPAQVYPNCQPWLHHQYTGQPHPTKPHDSTSGAVLPTGASSGRRGSRVVSFPSWLFPSKLSPHAVFLMASLLHPEPGKRLACEDACRSPWVSGASASS